MDLCLRSAEKDEKPHKVVFTNRQVWALLGPSLLEQFLSLTVGLADSMMVASVSDAAMSGVSLVDSISTLVLYLFFAMASGGAVVMGQYLGRKERDKACDAAKTMMIAIGAVAVVLVGLLYLFQKPILTFMFRKAEPDVMAAANTYYRIVMISLVPIALYNGGAALARTMKRPKMGLYNSILRNAINICGNALLLYVFKLGVAGVAIPTLAARLAGTVVILVQLKNPKYELNLSGFRKFRMDWKMLRNILGIGIPSGVENGMFQFGKIALLSLITSIGTAALTANSIFGAMSNVQIIGAVSVSGCMTTIISYCIGAGAFDDARYYCRKLLLVAETLNLIVNGIVFALFPVIFRIYSVAPEAELLARRVVLIHGFCVIVLYIFAFTMPVFLRSAGDAGYPMIVSVVSMWVCRVGFSYVLVRGFDMGLYGVVAAQCGFDWTVRAILFCLRYRSGKWEFKRLHD